MSLFLTVRTPQGNHCWDLGDRDADTQHDLILRARALLQFPHGDDWLDPGSGWAITVAPGEPHQDLRATVRLIGELSAVPAGMVAAWQAAEDNARRDERVKEARRAMAALDGDEKAALLDEFGRAAAAEGRHR